MIEFNPQRPFHNRYEFQATLSKGGNSIHGLHFILDYQENRPNNIEAYVLGSHAEFEKIQALMHLPDPYYAIGSKSFEGSVERVYSSKARIKMARDRHWPKEYGDRMVGPICAIELDEVTIENRFEYQAEATRSICFALAGPSSFWPLNWVRTRSYDGSASAETKPVKIDTLGLLKGEVELQPWYLYSYVQTEDGQQIEATDSLHSIVVGRIPRI